MQKWFFGILGVLIVASVYTWMTKPAHQSPYPLIAWRTDANPQRYEQVQLFQDWLIHNHPELPRKGENPPFGVSLSTSSNQSKLIQAVSGMGGDLIDGIKAHVYGPMGLVLDITEPAEKMGFGFADTYPGVRSLISYNGRQFVYPCNVAVFALWINKDTFRKYDLPIPDENWTPDEFARIGKEFVRHANMGGGRRTNFITVPDHQVIVVARSRGVDLYNETLTRSQATNQHYVKTFQMTYDWIYQDGFLPTQAEIASNNVETGAGFGGAAFSQFIQGTYAMINTERYSLIRFREIEDEQAKFEMTSVLYPQYKYKNMLLSARSTGIYAGSRNPEKALYFLRFLAGKEYNDYIIAHADGLPPNPAYAQNNLAFLRPEKYPNEGNVHANELRWAMTIALPAPFSPYYPPNAQDWILYAWDKMAAKRGTAKEVLAEAEMRMNRQIEETVQANPKLKKMFDGAVVLQKEIDKLKQDWKFDKDFLPVSGSKIPENWILNPFYKKFYEDMNMLAETAPLPQNIPAEAASK